MTRVVVVGDSLLDVDLEGHVERLSPEAPVPVFDTDCLRVRPGGAALAAVLAAREVDDVVLVSGIGSDTDGRRLAAIAAERCTVVPLELVGTTVTKTRVRTDVQHLLRIDAGDGVTEHTPISASARRAFDGADAIVVADYGRGTTFHPGIRRLLAGCARDIPIVWDPHPRGSAPTAGATLVTPNLREAYAALGAADTPAAAEAGRRLVTRWHVRAVAVTQGPAGATLVQDGHSARSVPVPERPSSLRTSRLDTCGAGDRFAAAAAAALAKSSSLGDAVVAAVDHASRFVSAGGAGAMATADRTDRPHRHRLRHTPTDACEFAARVHRDGGRVVATGGCFDVVHPGHLRLLHEAASFGDALIVCLNSDASVRRLKGPGRPVLGQEARADMLRQLDAVDAVVVFDEEMPVRVLDRLRPDVWVKGGDYDPEDLPEAGVVTKYGGEVRVVPTFGDYSTTNVVAAIRSGSESNRDSSGESVREGKDS